MPCPSPLVAAAVGGFLLTVVMGCGGGTPYAATPPDTAGGARAASVVRPYDYDPSVAYPLLLLLHGYGANAAIQDLYFGTSARVDTRGFVLVLPNGVQDGMGKQYWNAGPCCAFGSNPPDDVAYLVDLVDEVERTHHIDRKRVYVLGHSNGGAMAMKLACVAPERFTAIASLAGIPPEQASDCPVGAADVSVLTMHGDADTVVLYDGTTAAMGIPLTPYPSAPEVARRFAEHAGCDTSMPVVGTPFDLGAVIAGDETTPTRYETGCRSGTQVEFWSIAGGPHIPALTSTGPDRILDWLFARTRT